MQSDQINLGVQHGYTADVSGFAFVLKLEYF